MQLHMLTLGRELCALFSPDTVIEQATTNPLPSVQHMPVSHKGHSCFSRPRVRCARDVNSANFFGPRRVVDPNPLVIAAGFDGTGLEALATAYRTLFPGSEVRFPAIPMGNKLGQRKPVPARGTALEKLYAFGFQHPEYPPSVWSDVGLVAGHPVPLFVWDILEAFPKAKVVLTVRDVQVCVVEWQGWSW